MSRRLIRSRGRPDWIAVEEVGRSGGIACMWIYRCSDIDTLASCLSLLVQTKLTDELGRKESLVSQCTVKDSVA
jgi:hypothetical protein